MPDRTLEMTLLFDFFGDLLTEKQREYFDLYHNEDLSLAEIAENVGITRQGVYDIITRAEAALREFESKTGIIGRFEQMREKVERAVEMASEILRLSDSAKARESAQGLIDLLGQMKGQVL